MTAQQGKVYRYFRVDADKDVSGDTLEITLDDTDSASWFSTGVDYVETVDLPASCVAATPTVSIGYVGYWWRVFTGPTTLLPLLRGRNTVYGRLTDTPETPHFAWQVTVGSKE